MGILIEHFNAQKGHYHAEHNLDELSVQILEKESPGDAACQHQRAEGEQEPGFEMFAALPCQNEVGGAAQHELYRGDADVVDTEAQDGVKDEGIGKAAQALDEEGSESGGDPEYHGGDLISLSVCCFQASGCSLVLSSASNCLTIWGSFSLMTLPER